MTIPVGEPDPASLLLIVVGARLHAELVHRPLAYRLRERVLAWQDQRDEGEAQPNSESAADPARLTPVVCTDLWYVNAPALMARPTIALGDPGVNAASAYLANRLPTAFVIEQTLRVHLDPELIELQAALWGVNASATLSAVDLFCERYLARFLEAAGEA